MTVSLVVQKNAVHVNVKDYGAIMDGAHDDSAAFTAAYQAASNALLPLYIPGGTLVKGNDTLLSNVAITGAGEGVSIIKLKNGANTDLFSANTGSINLAQAQGTGSSTGANFWCFRNLTLDGNKSNQTAGPSYPIRVYGYGHILEHVEIRNGYSGGILLDWSGSSNPTPPNNALMPHWYDVMVHDCGGIGIEVGGPSDMEWTAVSGFATGSHVCHIAPNCIALRMLYCHFWSTPNGQNAVTLLSETAELQLASCQIEGSDTCALVVIGNDFQASGLEVGSTGDVNRVGRGIQFGQAAGATPYAGQILKSGNLTTANPCNYANVHGKSYQCQAGAIDEKNTTGNLYNFIAYQTAGNAIASNGGFPVSGSSGFFQVKGLSSVGDPGTGGFFQIRNNSYYGFQIYSNTGAVMFSIDTFDNVFQLKNGYTFSGYSNNGTTLKYSFDASNGNAQFNGNISVGQSATTPDPGNNGTITTANIGQARVTPTSNETGLILQAGSIAGQRCTVINNSASFSITFATSATSHVAQGTSLVIAANSKYYFAWDSVQNLWY